MAVKQVKDPGLRVEIGLKDGKEWSTEKLTRIKALIESESAKRSPERKMKNQLLSIRYQMEEYAEADENRINKVVSIEVFLKAYLATLKLSFKTFAECIDTKDANLKKYLTGDRKFNTDLAMKFGHFFHTSPAVWLKIQFKNELIQLRTGRADKKYAKYDFKKVV